MKDFKTAVAVGFTRLAYHYLSWLSIAWYSLTMRLTKHHKASVPVYKDYKTISQGSSLKFCLVASGNAEMYPRLGPTSEWDTAAGHAIVEFAGGVVETLDGKSLRYNTKKSLLNPEFLVCCKHELSKEIISKL